MDFEEAELGPCMQACRPKERLFVWHYLELGAKHSAATEAAELAGYVTPGVARNGQARVRAWELMHRERVIAAMDEVGRKAFRELLLPAVMAATRLVGDPKHPHHAKTVLSVLARLGLAERTGVDVNVTGEVTVSHTQEAVDQLAAFKKLGVPRDKLIEMFGFSGLTRYEGMLLEQDRKRLPVIEAEVIKSDGDAS